MPGQRRATLGLAPALPLIVLVVVIFWALAAVLMLTGTLVNAREIKDTVPVINSQVTPIDKDLDNVKRARETTQITKRIDAAAKPLSGQADRILVEAASIDGRVGSILGNAVSINETVNAINGNVRAINGKVSAINSSVASINDAVRSIEGRVLTINRTVSSIDGRVAAITSGVGSIGRRVGPVGARGGGSIKASVGRILTSFRRLEPETRSIDSGVAGINRRASRGINGVRALKSDFVPIAELVGSPLMGAGAHSSIGPGSIHAHANGIDCSKLINLFGNTQSYCNQ